MARLSQVTCGAGAKASLNRAIESHGVDPKPGDLPMARVKSRVISDGGPNLLALQSLLDELWVAVKCQANPEIAGSPRNAFRCSLG